MTAPIYFNVPEVRKYLKDHGQVYTVRRKRRTGITMAREGSYYNFRGIGEVRIEHQKTITKQSQLEPFVEGSGFQSVEEWTSAIRELQLPANEWELYYVEVLK